MTKYVIDTQILVRAFRMPDVGRSLDTFLSTSVVFLSAVAAHELLYGARPDEMRRLHREFLDRFESVERLAIPSYRAWSDAGTILRKMRAEGFQITRALTHDALIAVSAAEIGAIVFHDNLRDFAAIQRHYPRLQQMRAWAPFRLN